MTTWWEDFKTYLKCRAPSYFWLDVAYGFYSKRWRARNFREKLALYKKKRVQHREGLPSIIAFEPISACPLDCAFCMLRELKTYKFRKKVRMDLDEFKKIIDDIAHFATEIHFSGGEPLLHPDIFEMIRYARQHNIYTHLSSNAQLLDRNNNIERIIQDPPDEMLLAYEALDKETYESIRRRGDFDKLERNIHGMIRAKKESGGRFPVITLQMVLTKKNMAQEKAFWEMVRETGADYASVKALGVWPEGSPEYDKLMREEYVIPRSEHPTSRHDFDEEGNVVFYRKPGQCTQTGNCLIGSGGEVIPCWYIFVKTPYMGNAVEESLVDIWKSPEYVKYRHEMLHGWANPLCHKCIGVKATGTVKNIQKKN